jgi:pimeloyl-ACP methyl ester carboxylesterase
MTLSAPGPTSHSYFSQRLRLHYVDWGNPDARPLLLLHGGRDHCRNWDWVAQALRDDWHVIAPDLRGHGDSEWTSDGNYEMAGYIYDLAQLVHQQNLAPVTIVAHSLGGNIALRYSGLYPDSMRKLVAIEGLGLSPKMLAERANMSFDERLRRWVEDKRGLAGRLPRLYPTVESAYARMHAENKHLSPEQARHLTLHGINQNEDGSYSWKFDNYVRAFPAYDMPVSAVEGLWSQITCPTLLVYGEESWASNPAEDGRIKHFQSAEVTGFAGAGHWVHHDQLQGFLDKTADFIK